jgi:hypothetical protein
VCAHDDGQEFAVAAGTPYDFLRAHPSLFQDARRKCVVSRILFFCSFVLLFGVLREAVTVRDFSGDFPRC